MKLKLLKLCTCLFLVSISISGLSQVAANELQFSGPVADSLKKAGMIFNDQNKLNEINLNAKQAVEFLQHKIQPQYWINSRDTLRNTLGQLVYEASHSPYDSADYFLRKYPFDSLFVSCDKFYTRIRVISDPESKLPVDLTSGIDPANAKMTRDSLKAAVNILLDYVELRDSSIVNITGPGNVVIPVWLNSRAGKMQRYWLRNDMNDSVTVWIGASSRNTLELILEKGVTFRRPVILGDYSEAKIDVKEINKSKLLEAKKIVVKTLYWKYHSEASFALNQASLTNWVKGGESSISTSTDITGYADYNNKALKITSNNFARLKYGLLKAGNEQVKKNLDLLETNSKVNHKAFGKVDFSAILLFKTQIARGFMYPNDTTRILVSKFMNPAILTVGLGLDYKPDKNTSINFSPFSYKGTFVTDTTGTKGVDAVDQTKYGISKDRKSLNEPGASFMITNEYKPFKSVTVINRLQLFTNYINHPQNIDVDWEMILTANINWFTDVRFNTHLVFDDDTRTTVLDKERKPVLGTDNKPVKTARIQFKELLGFSFIFRF